MKTNTWLTKSTKKLEFEGIGTSRLDAIILLENVLGIDRAKLLADPEINLKPGEIIKLDNLLTRRTQHEPMAYILGQAEFYGRKFVVTPDVLVPRPESETMIDELKYLPNFSTHPLIADVGTGCGALGITAKLELPSATVELIDIDPNVLEVAKTNVDNFTSGISLINGDLLSKTSTAYDILLCNLPYVPDDFKINLAASREPKLAIYGGSDGLDVYRKLFNQLQIRAKRPLYILSESSPMQHTALEALAQPAGYTLIKKNDFIQVFRRIQK